MFNGACDSNEKQVLILRGLPGAGKSYYIQQCLSGLSKANYRIHSTDSFFIESGKYQFDENKLDEYHKQNLLAFERSLVEQLPLVICDNTNVKLWQIKPYTEAALKMGYLVSVKSIGLVSTLIEQPDVLSLYQLRNQHQVKQEIYLNMLSD